MALDALTVEQAGGRPDRLRGAGSRPESGAESGSLAGRAGVDDGGAGRPDRGIPPGNTIPTRNRHGTSHQVHVPCEKIAPDCPHRGAGALRRAPGTESPVRVVPDRESLTSGDGFEGFQGNAVTVRNRAQANTRLMAFSDNPGPLFVRHTPSKETEPVCLGKRDLLVEPQRPLGSLNRQSSIARAPPASVRKPKSAPIRPAMEGCGPRTAYSGAGIHPEIHDNATGMT